MDHHRFLHPEFRDALELPWNPRDQRLFEKLLGMTARLNGMLPKPIRTISYPLLLIGMRWRVLTGRPVV